jgi:hypothetical protein
MTKAKVDHGSESRPYSYCTGTNKGSKPHNMPAAEIRLLFIAVGWIGERKAKPPTLRMLPVFDRGPGPDIGR